jgi:hypothetical protein
MCKILTYPKQGNWLLVMALCLLAGCAEPSYRDGVYQPDEYYGPPVYGQPGYPSFGYYPGAGYYSGSTSYRVIERVPEGNQRGYRQATPPQPQQQQVRQQPAQQVQPPPPRDPGCGPGGRRNCEFGAGQNGK